MNLDIRHQTIIKSYNMHTSLLSEIIDGITHRDINHFKRGSNYIPWLVGSQIHLRYDVANWMGISETHNSEELFRNNKKVQSNITYPSLQTLNKDWKKISPVLKAAIEELSNDDLFTFSSKDPGKSGTFFDLLSFMIQRETKCIALINLWRGLLT